MKRACAKCGKTGNWKFVDCRHCYLLKTGKIAARGDNPNKYIRLSRAYDTERVRRWRHANKDKVRQSRLSAVQKRREYVYKLKEQPCTDCGNTFPPEAMDFDHVRGVKDRAVSRMLNAAADFDVLKEEIAKCDLVCANCHRIRTWQRRIALGA